MVQSEAVARAPANESARLPSRSGVTPCAMSRGRVPLTVADALRETEFFLRDVGYGDDLLETRYPVWTATNGGVDHVELAAFGRPEPHDMSTAVIAVSSGSIEHAHMLAEVLATPYFVSLAADGPSLWVAGPRGPSRWLVGAEAFARHATDWLRPATALKAKVGLRQLPLFDLPVDLLSKARTRQAEAFAPLVGQALRTVTDSLTTTDAATPTTHHQAARLVVGALTVLVMRDRRGWRSVSTDVLVDRVSQEHPTSFRWHQKSPKRQRQLLMELVQSLGQGIDYRSLDPAVLSDVYAWALVGEDDRRRLGIHYTPPSLAKRMLEALPVETIEPEQRSVIDPACGSGTLLVAAHDRLRRLQPDNWTAQESHRDLAVHLHGMDVDPFAAEIARLTLLLHAQPAGNGWDIRTGDALQYQSHPAEAPAIVVMNPPWRYTSSSGTRSQYADSFVSWAARTVRPGGLVGLILPGSWASADSSRPARSEIAADFDVFDVWNLPEGTFATSRQSATVVLGRKRDGLAGSGATLVRTVDKSRLERFLEGGLPTIAYLQPQSADDVDSTLPPPRVKAATRPLRELADILSGPQPLSGISDRGLGTPYIHRFGDVRSYAAANENVWYVAFPEDFQSARGAAIIDKRKILASAARTPTSPWRFDVAIDTTGIAIRNSVRGVAPKDQDDEDLLFALLIIIGSGFASAVAWSFGGDRNIPAAALQELPIPSNPDQISLLASHGRRAVSLSDTPEALNSLLRRAEKDVWRAYGVSPRDRARATDWLAGHKAPEGLPRYDRRPAEEIRGTVGQRRVGAVLDVTDQSVTLWVSGITPDGGATIDWPASMPGWLARAGATFDVRGVESVDDLQRGRYAFQPMAWRDLDFDSTDPKPILVE